MQAGKGRDNWPSTAKGRADTAKEGRQHVGNRACKQLKQYRQLLLVAHDLVVLPSKVLSMPAKLRVNRHAWLPARVVHL